MPNRAKLQQSLAEPVQPWPPLLQIDSNFGGVRPIWVPFGQSWRSAKIGRMFPRLGRRLARSWPATFNIDPNSGQVWPEFGSRLGPILTNAGPTWSSSPELFHIRPQFLQIMCEASRDSVEGGECKPRAKNNRGLAKIRHDRVCPRGGLGAERSPRRWLHGTNIVPKRALRAKNSATSGGTHADPPDMVPGRRYIHTPIHP